MRPWLPIVSFVLLSIFGSRYYVCKIKRVCNKSHIVAAPAKAVGPITFNWSNEVPILHGADSLLQAVSSDLKDGQVVQITGHYFYDEENPTDYQNLGQARAEEVKKLLAQVIDPQKIRVVSEPAEGSHKNFKKPFGSVTFDIVDLDINQAEVLDLGDKTVILFPHGSTEKDKNVIIDTYLNKLANELKANGSHVEITGHTDYVGNSKRNYALGLRRAKNIRDYLRKKGVNKKAIVTKSKGETEPIASNDTPAGRHQNRRVEIIVK